MAEEVYDYICSIGEIVDKLSIENIKCFKANEKAIAERKKEHPDVSILAECEFNARKAGEQRVRLKDELNKRIAEAIKRGHINTAPEVRTYDMKGL